MRLDKLLSSLGYCSRSEVARLIRAGLVQVRNAAKLKPDMHVTPDDVTVEGEPLDPQAGMVILLNKPAGYVCSASDSEGSTVYDLLPERFARRNPPLVCVGRLDKETSGLLLMSDDGDFVHRMTSPKHGVDKVYEVTLQDDLHGDEKEKFEAGGMLLAGEEKPLKPARVKILDKRRMELTINEGRYHQIRKMFAALGNEVIELKRLSVGRLNLDGVEEGEYRLLSMHENEVARSVAED